MPAPTTPNSRAFACDGCGECCEHFTMPESPDELQAMYTRWFTQKPGDKPTWNQDIWLIAPMVVFRRKLILQLADGTRQILYEYTCKHFDRFTRRCSIHAIRPRMCSGFPFYGHEKPIAGGPTNYPKCKYNPLY